MSHHKRRGTTRGLALTYVKERLDIGAITKATAVQYGNVLAGFADVAPHHVERISRRTVVAYLAARSHLSVNTRRHYHKVVSCFTDWLLRRGILTVDPFREIPKPTKVRHVHRALDATQVRALLEHAADQREIVILMLGLHAGLRRAELAGLEVGDVSLSARTVTVRHGKGGHDRLVPLADEACVAVSRYLADGGFRAGPLLRSHHHDGRGISAGMVGTVMRRLGLRAGVKVRSYDGVGTHALRHTCATDVYRRCKDATAVRDLLGHTSLATTEIYLLGLDTDQLRTAVDGRRYAA